MADTEDTHRAVVRADNADIDNHIAGYQDLIKDAAQADQIEHEMGVRQALRIHKKAVFWSMALSAALIVRRAIREPCPIVILTRITHC
jgi:SP family general alpha glucoside:H+ symporter-like MFS transporter